MYHYLHVMNRLAMSIILVCCLPTLVSAQLAFIDRSGGEEQDHQQSLKAVLLKFETQHQVSIVFQDQDVEDKMVDEKQVKTRKLEEALEQVLAPLGLTYEKVKSDVFVILGKHSKRNLRKVEKKKVSSGTLSPMLTAQLSQLPVDKFTFDQEPQEQTISGTVTDMETDGGMPGVNILVKGTSSGTVTDMNGAYTITVPDAANTLVFSSIGYLTEEVAIDGKSVIDVILSPDIQSLSEVVVTALGIERKRESLAYSVSEVKGEEFTEAREPNVANALTGKIAGVNATGLATGPGGSSRVIIRGNGSLVGDNQPLYVVNGMPIDNTIPGEVPAQEGRALM